MLNKKTQLGKIAQVGIVTGLVTVFVGGIYLLGGTGRADAQEQDMLKAIQTSQATYELQQVAAKNALQEYCNTWKTLANQKLDLTEATGLQAGYTREQVSAVDCGLNVPASFL